MATQVTSKFQAVFLWDNEIKAAAKALRSLEELAGELDDSDESKEQYGEALRNTLRACYAALHGADRDDAVLILSRPADIFGQQRTKGKASARQQQGEPEGEVSDG